MSLDVLAGTQGKSHWQPRPAPAGALGTGTCTTRSLSKPLATGHLDIMIAESRSTSHRDMQVQALQDSLRADTCVCLRPYSARRFPGPPALPSPGPAGAGSVSRCMGGETRAVWAVILPLN
jgi:hypothetical protein